MDRPTTLIFTDLDGTLLDHETYSYAPALPALEMLTQRSIPLVLASSKTAAEMAPLRDELGFTECPAIVENGAGILAPNTASDGSNSDYLKLRQTLDRIEPFLREQFKGFGDMSVAEVVDVTGLSEDAATLSKTRHYSEPGIFSGDAEARAAFINAAENAGLKAKMGGRFLTFSFGGDKATQMRNIAAHYPQPTHIIALGDAPNDIAMLEAADIGIIIPNPAHDGIAPLDGESDGSIIRAAHHGPKGWNDALFALLKKTDNQAP